MDGRIRLAALLLLGMSGCTQNPFAPGQAGSVSVPSQPSPPQVAQLQELDQRNRKLDANNADLHKQLAQAQQQAQLMQDEVVALRKQLNEMANQVETEQVARQEAVRRYEALEASTRYRGGATITANNSLRDSLKSVEIPGLEVRRDGDVIRIEIPADQLFEPGTVRWQTSASQTLDRVAEAISRDYARQLVAIEGHTDPSTLREASNLHQLAASQTLAVLQHFTQRNRLPERQFFTIDHGPNQALVSNGTPAGRARNRRIEVVIYPDSF